jgi:hypothetical protein
MTDQRERLTFAIANDRAAVENADCDCKIVISTSSAEQPFYKMREWFLIRPPEEPALEKVDFPSRFADLP